MTLSHTYVKIKKRKENSKNIKEKEDKIKLSPLFIPLTSMIEPTTSNSFSKRIQPVPAPVIIDSEPKYEISQIVDSKIDHQQTCKLLYKVIWLGYKDTRDKSEWISTLELTHSSDLISNFHLAYPNKSSLLSLF